MELRQLRYFVAVAEDLHFGRAAARLDVAQPSLSQQIQQLERELGYPLLIRTSRHVSCTESGRAFLERAKLTLAMAEQARDAGRQAAAGQSGHVSVGFVASAALNVLPPVLRAYRRCYPAVQLTLHELLSEELLTALLERRLDVALVRRLAVNDQITLTPVLRLPLVLALHQSHPLAELEVIPLDALANVGFVVRARASDAFGFARLMQTCAAAGFAPRVVQEVPTTLSALGMVAAGMGVTVVPATSPWLHLPEVVFRGVEPALGALELDVASRRDETAPAVLAFRRVMIETAQQLRM